MLFVFGIDSSVNKKGLQAIADAGRGKAEFIVRDEQIKEIILRQFARVSSSNLFDIGIFTKSNRVTDKIEKQRMLFNHEFYDVLVEVDAIVDDFDLHCKTDALIYSFIVSKEKLERLDVPLHKIWASEQIRRVEKYIEARPHDENKGYKEQIVELAVEYQIDSKYTAFIAVNERDEKLSDIPELQETVLESPAGWDMPMQKRHASVLHAYRNPAMMSHADSCMDEPAIMSHADSFDEMCCLVEEPAKPKRASGLFHDVTERFRSIAQGFFLVDEDLSEKFEEIFQKIKLCEEMILKKEAYQTLLDEIIKDLEHAIHPYLYRNHPFSEEQIQKIKDEAPNVYALVEEYFVTK